MCLCMHLILRKIFPRKNGFCVNDALQIYEMVCSFNGHTYFSEIVAGVFLIICTDYMLQMSIDIDKRKLFHIKQKHKFMLSRKKKKVANADYAHDLALPTNTLVEAKSMLHSLEATAKGIGLHGSTDKTEFMSFD